MRDASFIDYDPLYAKPTSTLDMQASGKNISSTATDKKSSECKVMRKISTRPFVVFRENSSI